MSKYNKFHDIKIRKKEKIGEVNSKVRDDDFKGYWDAEDELTKHIIEEINKGIIEQIKKSYKEIHKNETQIP